MVDIGTWNRLSPDEQTEVLQHRPAFIAAVLQSGIADGWAFAQRHRITGEAGGHFMLTDSRMDGDGAFAGIRSRSRAVIEALLADAAQNHGR